MSELVSIFRVLRRRWWLVLLPVLVVLLFILPDLPGMLRPAEAGGFITTIRYSAAQAFNLPERDGDYQDVWLASEFTVNAFTEWVRGGSFRAEVAALLAESGQQDDLAGLSVASDNARSIGVVYLTHPDAEALRRIAYAAIEVLQTRSQDYFPQLGGDPARVTLLDEPQVAPQPPSLANRFAPLLRLAVALLAGLGLAVLAEYLDDTVRDRAALEAGGLRVLASVPRHRQD